ncbi:hypothetical protein PTSG_06512 [Salpingoeca rosetta]|uniref:PIN domain-containing protein n=1 Tax=Salpingoeca rosetta (strain ATCC 50818 / BSB-021) TaxID=946362 RepID=F2UG09_SALR5|nr:uncharacterized protein PTSG_06512 [Salpingoeca rosetta]EGD75437.1 hypothetical protein PTSG_06512 [Salpingoeca rosetta]|eukprot:XP_004991894.1 hypothetical protein PTSG_06512 [Salpingoeca rosetta]
MGKMKRTKRFALVKRMISAKEKQKQLEQEGLKKKKKAGGKKSAGTHGQQVAQALMGRVSRHEQASSALYFHYNTQLGPPYHILIDTNFINFALQNKLDILQASMDCLFAKCIPCITDCVMAELEKLGRKYRIALKVAKDPRFKRLPCMHKGTYADDCLVNRVSQHKCYIVATCDRDLKRRIRKIPGVPIMFIAQRKFTIERLPDAH